MVPSTTSMRAEIDGKRFSEMIEIDGSFLGYLAGGAEPYRVKAHCFVLIQNHRKWPTRCLKSRAPSSTSMRLVVCEKT